ncbi:hypothetical protein Scep_016547 [Stephania cephalantha]|uniref:Uncharacterized protein n=1 Tax=Stephania cephalantha TaxID=152367 RepID=A0AAP0IMU1_9MAGN
MKAELNNFRALLEKAGLIPPMSEQLGVGCTYRGVSETFSSLVDRERIINDLWNKYSRRSKVLKKTKLEKKIKKSVREVEGVDQARRSNPSRGSRSGTGTQNSERRPSNVINHGVPIESITSLESKAVKFFSLAQNKSGSGTPDPFGYENKSIGPNVETTNVKVIFVSVVAPDVKAASRCPRVMCSSLGGLSYIEELAMGTLFDHLTGIVTGIATGPRR